MRLTRRALLAGLGAGAALTPSVGFAASPPRGLKAVDPRPEMLDIALHIGGGGETEFRALRGKPVVLVFWATWCGVCRGEMPKLNALQEELGDAVHVAALSVDREGMAKVGPYLDRRDLHALVPYVDAQGVIAEMMRVRGVPTAFVIDPKGRVAAAGGGRIDWDGDATKAYLAALDR